MEPSMMEFDFLVGKDWNTEGGHKRVTTEYSVDTVGRGLLVTVLREGVMLSMDWTGQSGDFVEWSIFRQMFARSSFRRPVTRVTLAEDSQTG